MCWKAQTVAERIFVSYRRSDSRASAGRLYETLSQRFGGSTIFKDVSNIAVGANFRTVIVDAVNESAAMVVVIGPGWMSDYTAGGSRQDDVEDYVQVEVEQAIRMGVPLFPVLVDGASMPRYSELPPSIGGIASVNAAELDHDTWSRDVDKLLSALSALIDEEDSPDNASRHFETQSRQDESASLRSRRTTLVLAGICLIAGVVAGRLSSLVATVSVGIGINLLTQILQGIDLRPLRRALALIPWRALRELLLRQIPSRIGFDVELAGHRAILTLAFAIFTVAGMLAGRASISDAFDLETSSSTAPPATSTSSLPTTLPGFTSLPTTVPGQSSADYPFYETITDSTGSITVNVPTEWTDRRTGLGTDNLPQIAAAPIIEGGFVGNAISGGFIGTFDKPGIQITVAAIPDDVEIDVDSALDVTLDGFDQPDCTVGTRSDIAFPLPGRIERFSDCGGGDTRIVHIAYIDDPEGLVAVLRIQVVDDRDDVAVDTIRSSLELEDNVPE